MTSTWRKGETTTPARFTSGYGAAAVHGNTVYFSCKHDIYSYTVPDSKWTKLPSCKYENFSMVAIDGKLTTIGGQEGSISSETNVLLTLTPGRLFGNSWKEVVPPMPTKRIKPAAVTNHTHLVVAGGIEGLVSARDAVEALDTSTLQWFTAKSLPQPVGFPQMTLCGGHISLIVRQYSRVPWKNCSSLVHLLPPTAVMAAPCGLDELTFPCNMAHLY